MAAFFKMATKIRENAAIRRIFSVKNVQIWLKAPNFAQSLLEMYLLKCDRDPFDIFPIWLLFSRWPPKFRKMPLLNSSNYSKYIFSKIRSNLVKSITICTKKTRDVPFEM